MMMRKSLLSGAAMGFALAGYLHVFGGSWSYNACFTGAGNMMRCVPAPGCKVLGYPCVIEDELYPPHWVHGCSAYGYVCEGGGVKCHCFANGQLTACAPTNPVCP